MEGVCCNGDSHLLQRQREQKVFVEMSFTSVTRRVAWKVFVLGEFHICYNESGKVDQFTRYNEKGKVDQFTF